MVVRSAHCRGCGHRVDLTAEGECPQGHLKSMLRDVREGPATPPTASPAPVRTRGTSPVPVADVPRGQELLAVVLGKAIVIVPIAAILAFGLWTGYESAAGEGVSVAKALLISAGSLALTVGLAFVWASRRSAGR